MEKTVDFRPFPAPAIDRGPSQCLRKDGNHGKNGAETYIAETYIYDAVGNRKTRTSTINGARFGSSLNLYQLRARYYNMLRDGFMTVDPIDGKLIDPRSLHRYLYAGGNPVNRIDPSGRKDSEGYITLDLRAIRTLLKENQIHSDCLNLLILSNLRATKKCWRSR